MDDNLTFMYILIEKKRKLKKKEDMMKYDKRGMNYCILVVNMW